MTTPAEAAAVVYECECDDFGHCYDCQLYDCYAGAFEDPGERAFALAHLPR